MVFRVFLSLACLWGCHSSLISQTIQFAVIGDSGTGGEHQTKVARQMAAFYRTHPWDFVLMLGDNIYGDGAPSAVEKKFKNVYRDLPIPFHATLGNHDRKRRKGLDQVEEPAFGYVGKQDEYTFTAGPTTAGRTLLRFICLNSGAWRNDEDLPEREARLDRWLAESSRFHWNVVLFHHPIYSYARSMFPIGLLIGRYGHGSDVNLRNLWEERFKDGGIDFVLSGHDHFYQKIRPQSGIHYFVSGAAGQVRKGVRTSHPEVEFAAETHHFLHFEISPTRVQYEAVDEDGNVFHRGIIEKVP